MQTVRTAMQVPRTYGPYGETPVDNVGYMLRILYGINVSANEEKLRLAIEIGKKKALSSTDHSGCYSRYTPVRMKHYLSTIERAKGHTDLQKLRTEYGISDQVPDEVVIAAVGHGLSCYSFEQNTNQPATLKF